MAFPARLVCLSTLLLLPSSSIAEEPVPGAVKEHLTVHATRLPDEEEPVDAVPAHVTVLTRQDLERSGARTLQDALALEAGVVLYDQVGNDVEKTLDLRGFAEGTGTAVFLDGVRLNDPRSNATALESIPLGAVERIEVTRGSAAGLIGGGAEAGVIRVLTRQGVEPGGALSVSGGSDGALRASGHVQGKLGEFELFGSAAHDETDGFRATNGQSALDRYALRAGLPLAGGHRLDFTALLSHLDAGAPGALKREEADADFWQNQFNLVDGNDTRTRQAALAYQGSLARSWRLAADLSVRDLQAELLTTGRSAFGFFVEEDTLTLGSTVEASHHAGRSTLTLGAEWWDGRVDARGFLTDDGGTIPDPSRADSDNRSTRSTGAAFVRESFALHPHWTLQAGLRADRDRIEFQEHAPFAPGPPHEAHTYAELSGRAGAAWNPSPRFGAFASFSESFLPPTTEQLFAFGEFGSNASLEPERATAWELGARAHAAPSLDLTTSVFLIDTKDEIVFDPNVGLFGTNVNAGETRRQGLEVAAHGRGGSRVSWFGRLTLMDAAFRAGEVSGNDVPLVPGSRAAAGVDLHLWRTLRLNADVLHVSSQVLDNDRENQAPELPSYTVASARVSWQVHRNLVMFAEGRNLFDERYASRGISVLNFTTFENDVFITPAPGRRWFGGATLTF
ncbi:MAG TPA: TonB-dependent receptor [Candidatus Polarisedimenticolaceae bacterium]|nr:TonB-dependent receptor [Candidatus Polarisedimenticolaceae bacterium]